MTTHASPQVRAPGRSARPVLLVLLAVVALAATLFFYRYRQSRAHLAEAAQAARRIGKNATVEQCVDHVVKWAGRCSAIGTLCEAAMGRLTTLCLNARSRSDYCAALSEPTTRTQFGYHECQSRGATEGLPKKACARAYRVIDQHCRELTASTGTG